MQSIQEICINLRESLLAGLRWQPHSRTSGVLGTLVLLWKLDELVNDDFLSSALPEICCLAFQRLTRFGTTSHSVCLLLCTRHACACEIEHDYDFFETTKNESTV